MQKTLAIVMLLVAVGATAGTITSVSPSIINRSSGEYFMTIEGTGLGDRLVYNGPTGVVTLDISSKGVTNVIGWVPEEIVLHPGTYTVTVLDALGGTSGPATFNVVDPNRKRWPLLIQFPDSIAFVAIGRTAIVQYDVSATDGEDSTAPVTCEPKSGSLFGVGKTIVNCTAINALGETAKGSFDIFVHDATAPVLNVPGRIVVKADAREGSFVKFDVSALDEVNGIVPVGCDGKSGSLFPVGITTVGCWATDLSFNTGRRDFTIEVVDETAKMALHVEPVFAEAESSAGAAVTYDVYATGTLDPNPTIVCDPKSGSLFAIGATTVKCSAKDSFGATAAGSFDVTVADTTGPLIDGILATPSQVAATGDYVGVVLDLKVFDAVDPLPRCAIAYVYGSEPLGANDWSLAAALELKLLALTTGTENRIYHAVVECTDASQNTSFAEGLVTVLSRK